MRREAGVIDPASHHFTPDGSDPPTCPCVLFIQGHTAISLPLLQTRYNLPSVRSPVRRPALNDVLSFLSHCFDAEP